MATGHYRVENGTILELDLPLPDAYHTRVARGEIVRVNPDGSPYAETAPAHPADDPGTSGVAALEAELADTRAELALAAAQRDALAAELAARNVAPPAKPARKAG